MSEKIKSEMISRRGLFRFGLGGCVGRYRTGVGDDRNGCRGRRWSTSLSREHCWNEPT